VSKPTKQTEYKEINVILGDLDYWIEVAVTLSVIPPDYTTWYSDLDYYGYTEVQDWKVLSIYLYDSKEDAYFPHKVEDHKKYKKILDIIQYKIEDIY
jgi:hypothetical protein